uniref:TrmE-type G domain-containing protein n=4 Tax=Arion vulgaris TaxID=1028688 RepID=A0A0B7A6K0_9EUPU
MDPSSKEVLDKALVLWFPGPNSFTGEDCAEFHVHGGPAVISSVLSALSLIDGYKPAQAGEFTKQAFLNGKLDLTEVEGLGDLIHAETEAQRKQALRQMEGDLGIIYTEWRTRLIKCLANTEAFIDFHEEENIEDGILDSVTSEVTKVQKEILDHLKDSRRGERLRDGLHVVILGEPNVGKSTLLNAICQRPAAIVSPIAGTTRDIVETALNIAGYPVLLSDTAGLRETSDVVEKEGVSRALERAHSADLKILMLDLPNHLIQLESAHSLSDFVNSHMQKLGLLQDDTDIIETGIYSYNESRAHTLSRNELVNHTEMWHISRIDTELSNQTINETSPDLETINIKTVDLSNLLIVVNKCDLAADANMPGCILNNEEHICNISCKTGEGLATFMELLVSKVKTLCGDPLSGSPSLTQTRHRHHLNKCQKHLIASINYVHHDVVLSAERLRLATRELGLVTGVVSVEDVLDVIFRDFCIGK